MIAANLIFFCIPAVYVASYSLEYLYTAISGNTTFPEFTVVGTLNDHHFVYFDSDSKVLVPRTEWIRENAGEFYWELHTEPLLAQYKGFMTLIDVVRQQVAQTDSTAVHTFQNHYGCSWDAQTQFTDAFHNFASDGEDFIYLDLNTMTWQISAPQALQLKQRWDKNTRDLNYLMWYFNKECQRLLRMYIGFAREAQKQKIPSVSLLQTGLSSPVTCHTTSFYPSDTKVFWRNGSEEQLIKVEYGDVLPNEDGTFQKTAVLLVTPEEWEKSNFSCVVELAGQEVLAVKLQRGLVRSNQGPRRGRPRLGLQAAGGLALLLGVAAAGLWAWRRMRSARGSRGGGERGGSSALTSILETPPVTEVVMTRRRKVSTLQGAECHR